MANRNGGEEHQEVESESGGKESVLIAEGSSNSSNSSPEHRHHEPGHTPLNVDNDDAAYL